jgi:flavin-binding protein dodecin
MSVYKVIELVGTSQESWEEAAREAIMMAHKSLRELRIAEVVKLDVRLDDGDIIEYRVRLNVSFKYED